MKYKVSTVPITQLVVSDKGVVDPLCDSCVTKDCTNKIEKKQVAVMGVTKQRRILMKGSNAYFVINCEGYSS